MITNEKLAVNLKELKNRLPNKSEVYTTEHPNNINEALIYYCNQRTVHGVQFCTVRLNEDNWPLPLWFDSDNVRIGFRNKFYYKKLYKSMAKSKKFKELKVFDFYSILLLISTIYKRPIDKIILEAFYSNKNYVFQKILNNPILKSKIEIINSIRKSYENKNWIACISNIFPIIDFVTRTLLGTKNLSVDVSKICKLFSKNGFPLESVNDLMPFSKMSFLLGKGRLSLLGKEWDQKYQKMKETDFGLIGPSLSSFIRFANIYYSYYREDIGI